MEPSADNFPTDELRCKCTACEGLVPNECSAIALILLQQLRDAYGYPLYLTSAYRCALHPDEVAKEKGPGRHHEGIAFDIHIPWGRDRMKIISLALELGFRGFGFGNTFLHIDMRTGPFTCWSY